MDERGAIPRLPDAELAVMQALWALGEYPAHTGDIAARLGKDWKAPTLLKLLSRLEERGFVAGSKEGRANGYTPLVRREDYLASANYSVQEVETVDSVRGEILDRYGRVLVTNSVQYNVTLDTTLMGEERNEILSSLLALCREQGVEWTDSLPVSDSAPWSYTRTESLFSYESEDEDGNTAVYPTNLGRLAENRGWVEEAETADVTAEELLRAMAGTFGLEIGEDAAVSHEDRQLMGVLYELYLRAYDVVSSEYVFARDVDIAFISTVK